MSTLLTIIRKGLRQHALSTAVTSLCVALGTGLVMAVFMISDQATRAFTGGAAGFDGVLGARGSQLQLVLNAVFHLEASPGNIPWSMYRAMKEDPRVSLAIPYAVGDNYKGYRIVGTTEEIFTKFQYRKGQSFQLAEGNFFDPGRREAVIGSVVAQRLGLKVGDIISPYHGLTYDPAMQHGDEYLIVGVLKPTNSPSDRVIWIPIEGIFRMEGHVLRGTGKDYVPEAGVEIPEEAKEVSAVMLKFRNVSAGLALSRMINMQGNAATLAYPVDRVILDLFDRIGWVTRVLTFVAWLTVGLASMAILAAITNTINERRREFAILRSLGARRRLVLGAIVGEGAATAAIGALLAFPVYISVMAVAAAIIREQTGVVLEMFRGGEMLLMAPLVSIVLGALAGLPAALRAYATDVATHLSPTT